MISREAVYEKCQSIEEKSNILMKVFFINNINNVLLYLSDYLLSNRLTRQKCLANAVLFIVRGYNIYIYCMNSADAFSQSDTAFADIQFTHSLGNVCLLALNWQFSVKRNLDVLWLKTVHFILYVFMYVFKRKFTIISCALYPDCCLLNRLRWLASDIHDDIDNFWFICFLVTDRVTQKESAADSWGH